MAVDVIMPQMGESIFEGTITKWLKKAGDKIERDEPLFEISTDKVDAEIPSPSAGVLKEIKVNEGQTVPIQTVVAIIDADGAAAQSAAPAPSKPEAATSAKSGAPAAAAAQPAKAEPAKEAPAQSTQGAASAPATGSPSAPQRPAVSSGAEKVRSSPLVRRIARENDVDLTQVPGTGAGGRVSKHDILAAVEGGAPSAASARPAAASGAAPSRSARNRRRLGVRGARKRRAARKNVLRPLRSSAHVGDEATHRRAHGAVEARFSARVFGGRSERFRDRRIARQDEDQVRGNVRNQADVYAVFRASGGGSAAEISHREFVRGRNEHRAAQGMQHRHRGGSGLGIDRTGD